MNIQTVVLSTLLGVSLLEVDLGKALRNSQAILYGKQGAPSYNLISNWKIEYKAAAEGTTIGESLEVSFTSTCPASSA